MAVPRSLSIFVTAVRCLTRNRACNKAARNHIVTLKPAYIVYDIVCNIVCNIVYDIMNIFIKYAISYVKLHLRCRRPKNLRDRIRYRISKPTIFKKNCDILGKTYDIIGFTPFLAYSIMI